MGGMYEAFKSDSDLERKGVVINYGKFRVTIARAGGSNKAYQKELERRTRPYMRALRNGIMDDEVAEQLMKEVYSSHIVLDWEVLQEDGSWVSGIEGPDGELLPVTKENILLTFNNLDDLYEDIKAQANRAALFRASLREEAAKNS